ncbi:hypothetical protein [Asticcacaulis sp. AC402]|uniref:hypothetical protein n=1 Tax=Asticcacaulis sp. AC402 TaxID=1282361 RepID=UPI0012DD286B|nr:hypothetical protein [Asticcacaulis sp. AC402]
MRAIVKLAAAVAVLAAGLGLGSASAASEKLAPECYVVGLPSSAPERTGIDCFVIDTGNTLQNWQRRSAPTMREGWTVVGSGLSPNSRAISCFQRRNTGRRDCFAISAAGHVVHSKTTGSSWGAWEDLGAPGSGSIDHADNELTCLNYSINLACLVRTDAGQVYMKRYRLSGTVMAWTDWEVIWAGHIGNCVTTGVMDDYCTLFTAYSGREGPTSNVQLLRFQKWQFPDGRPAAFERPVWGASYRGPGPGLELTGRPACHELLFDFAPGATSERGGKRVCFALGAGGDFDDRLWVRGIDERPGMPSDPATGGWRSRGVPIATGQQPNCVILTPRASWGGPHPELLTVGCLHRTTLGPSHEVAVSRYTGSEWVEEMRDLQTPVAGPISCVAQNSASLGCFYRSEAGQLTMISVELATRNISTSYHLPGVRF